VVPESVPGVVSAGRVVVSCEPPVSVVPVGFVSGGPFGSLPVVPERALSSSSPLLSTQTRTSCVARTSRSRAITAGSRERISSFESPSLPQLSISLRMSWSACFPSAVKWTGPSAAITNWYAVAKVSQSVQPAFAAAATFGFHLGRRPRDEHDLDGDRGRLAGVARGVGDGGVPLVDDGPRHVLDRPGEVEEARVVGLVDRDRAVGTRRAAVVVGARGGRREDRGQREDKDGEAASHGVVVVVVVTVAAGSVVDGVVSVVTV